MFPNLILGRIQVQFIRLINHACAQICQQHMNIRKCAAACVTSKTTACAVMSNVQNVVSDANCPQRRFRCNRFKAGATIVPQISAFNSIAQHHRVIRPKLQFHLYSIECVVYFSPRAWTTERSFCLGIFSPLIWRTAHVTTQHTHKHSLVN